MKIGSKVRWKMKRGGFWIGIVVGEPHSGRLGTTPVQWATGDIVGEVTWVFTQDLEVIG